MLIFTCCVSKLPDYCLFSTSVKKENKSCTKFVFSKISFEMETMCILFTALIVAASAKNPGDLCHSISECGLDWLKCWNNSCVPKDYCGSSIDCPVYSFCEDYCKCSCTRGYHWSNDGPIGSCQLTSSPNGCQLSCSQIGAIIGGTVGGVVFILIVIAAVFYIRKRKRQNLGLGSNEPSYQTM